MTVDATAPGPCSDCGLCCNGVLFDRAKAAPGEESRIVSAGAELFDEDVKTYFRQPCPQSSGGRCMIYADRFKICRSFECALLRAVRTGEIDISSARAKVAGARTLLDRVIADSPGARTASGRAEIRAMLANQIAQGGPTERKAVSSRLLAIVALDSFLKRWFRVPDEESRGM